MKNIIFLVLVLLKCIDSLPVDKKTNTEHLPPNADPKIEEEINDLGLEYGRYLQEVVIALEQDKHFSAKLQNISSDDIKSGKIAGELDFVHHNIRTKLDELKRIELDRLRKLIKQENELNENGGSYIEQDGRKWRTVIKDSLGHNLLKYDHVDHRNPHQFSKEDLHKLIIKASHDLEEIDKKRKEEFKQYEMEKEFQYQESLKNLTQEEKTEKIKKHDEQVKKHKEHPRIHHPGSKQQFEEVWEQQDHMPKEEFDPKTFFALHDLNGDGVLDQEEVESLLSTEIKKIYDPNNPEDDLNEMQEEYHRMREHIYKDADKNRDGLISRKEFIDLTSKPDFDKDEGWKTLDEQQVYSQEELKQYEKHRQEALAHQYAYYVPEYHPQMMPNQFVPYNGVPQYQPMAGHPQQFVQHPNGQHPNAPPQVAYQQNPPYAQQPQHYGQPVASHPQQAQIAGSVPSASNMNQGSYQSNQGYIQPGNIQQGQIPQGQIPQGQIHPGQIHPGQIHPGQIQPGQVQSGQVQSGQVQPGQIQQPIHGQQPNQNINYQPQQQYHQVPQYQQVPQQNQQSQQQAVNMNSQYSNQGNPANNQKSSQPVVNQNLPQNNH